MKQRQIATRMAMMLSSVTQFSWTPTLVCPKCRMVPVEPVTGVCGHTWCADCAMDVNEARGKCACGAKPPRQRNTDVVVRGLIDTLFPNQRLAAEKYRLAVYYETIDIASAKNICIEAIEIDPRNVQLRLLRAKLHLRAGELSLAKIQLNILSKIDPRVPEAHFIMGHVLKKLRKYEDSIKCFFVARLLGHSRKAVRHSMDELQTYIDDNNYFVIPTTRRFRPRFMNNVRTYVRETIHKCNNFRKEAVTAPSSVDVSELECTVCSLCYLQPVVTPCGHTFCRHCVERCLDHDLCCPLCNASIEPMRRVNELKDSAFVKAMALSVPYELRVRNFEKPDMLPLMICTTGLPFVSCPLLIKEGRYRLMMRRALASGSRQFGMVSCMPSPNNPDPKLRHSEFGTLLEIKDCLTCEDGSLILSTVGLTRFRVKEMAEVDGYEMARVETLRDRAVDRCDEELLLLQARVLEKAVGWVRRMYHSTRNEIEHSFGPMPHNLHPWEEDGPRWAWWLVAAIPLTPHIKRMMLGCTVLGRRLRAIEKALGLRQLSLRDELPRNEGPQPPGGQADPELDITTAVQLEQWLVRPPGVRGLAEFAL